MVYLSPISMISNSVFVTFGHLHQFVGVEVHLRDFWVLLSELIEVLASVTHQIGGIVLHLFARSNHGIVVNLAILVAELHAATLFIIDVIVLVVIFWFSCELGIFLWTHAT